MKKLIAILTAFVLLAGIFQIPGVAYAEEKTPLTLKQAIETAKTTLGIKTEGYDFNSSYAENQNGYNIWSLNWTQNKITNEYINVSLDADTGKINTVNWWTPYEQPKSRIPKHTKAEALKAAEDIAVKLQGDKFKQTRLSVDSNNYYYNRYSDSYNFNFVRVYDGVDVPFNNITVELDKNTLKLRTFNIVWDKSSLPSKAGAFDLEKAKQIFKEKLGLELTYNLVYNNENNGPSVVLAYTLKNGSMPIDALSGDVLNNMYRIYFTSEKAAPVGAADQAVITPEEQNELTKNSSYITKDEAVQIVKQYITIDENMSLERANLYPGYQRSNANWNLEWRYSNKEDNSYKYLSVQIDAVTKELKSLYKNVDNAKQDKDQKPIEKDQAKKLAEEFINKVQPDKFKSTQYKEAQDQFGNKIMPQYQNGYSFSYIRTENGISCPANSLNATVNEYTGEIVSFNANWLDINFPAPDKVITIDKAYETLFREVKFGMQYIYNYPDMNDYEKRVIHLAYSLDNTYVLINANSGQMQNYDGTPVKPVEKIAFTDIKGNKAEDEINILVDMGIIVPENTKFSPDEKMLQKDFIKLLISAMQPEYYIGPDVKTSSVYDNYYNEAIRRKIITEAERKPEAYVTRQDTAKMIIKAMGYGVIAEKSAMFAINFKDAQKLTPAYKGYAVMASELGIITPVKSYFYPSNNITRGDAAEFIVNYLKCETSL